MSLVLLQMSMTESLQLPVQAQALSGPEGEGQQHIVTYEAYCFVLLSN